MTDSIKKDRPDFIKHVSELPGRELTYESTGAERFGTRTSISRPLGFERVGVHHDELAPGERASLPHAESLEEEMVYILSGTPDAWINGELHRLGPGDSVVFVPGTGIIHTIINRTEEPVRFLAIGDRHPDNKWIFSHDPAQREYVPEERWWDDAPEQ